MQFCEKLYALRQERGLTQKQVGEALSMAARGATTRVAPTP